MVAACVGLHFNMFYISTKHLLEGWKSHYSYQGLDMVLFYTAIRKIPSCGFLEGDILVLLCKISGA